jgi:hypothetical protein
MHPSHNPSEPSLPRPCIGSPFSLQLNNQASNLSATKTNVSNLSSSLDGARFGMNTMFVLFGGEFELHDLNA